VAGTALEGIESVPQIARLSSDAMRDFVSLFDTGVSPIISGHEGDFGNLCRVPPVGH